MCFSFDKTIAFLPRRNNFLQISSPSAYQYRNFPHFYLWSLSRISQGRMKYSGLPSVLFCDTSIQAIEMIHIFVIFWLLDILDIFTFFSKEMGYLVQQP